MPTATSTLVNTAYSNQIPLKGAGVTPPRQPSISSAISSTTTATLRTLYNRAARAFLLRDIALTYSLIESAFALIRPPDVVPDSLSDQRRKWDILRITLESTVYSSPPASNDLIPRSLQESLMETPHALLTSTYARSLALFTPDAAASQKSKPNAAYLPPQVLITIGYSSLRIDCPDLGRTIIEEWLSRRDAPHLTSVEGAAEDGYGKILELYCLQILPKLEQWEYAQEFLEYEGELVVAARENLKKTLKTLHTEASASSRSRLRNTNSLPPPPFLSGTSSRSHSPTPSSSSSSSSLSTTSTHTIVPVTNRNVHSPITSIPFSASTTSLSSNSTVTPRQTSTQRPFLKSRTANSSASSAHLPRPYAESSALRPTNLTTYQLIKAFLTPYLSTSGLSTFFILFVVFPLISVIIRARRRNREASLGNHGITSSAELVRRRLQARGANDAGILANAWGEIIRVVSDTVKMAGSGLV